MSEEIERTQNTLLSTDDPMVWAEEFCRIFNGKMVKQGGPDTTDEINEGGMVAWFANAMQTALDIKARRAEIHEKEAPVGTVPEVQREAFVEGFEDGRATRPVDLDDPTA